MAINWVDGFEMYNANVAGLGLATRWTGGASISSTGSRTGAQCLATSGSGGGWASRPVPPSSTQGFAFARFSPLVERAELFSFREGSVVHGILLQNTDGSVTLCRGNYGTVIATSPPNMINFNSYNFYELENFVCSYTSGAATVKINGVLAISFSDADTQNGGTGIINNIYFESGSPMPIDDCYSTTGPTYGDHGMFPIYADSDDSVQWVPDSGSNNYSRINERVPNGDTSFVQASTTGEVDQYGFQDLPSTITNVTAVSVVAYARKTDTGSRTFASRIEMGGDDFETADYGLSDTYARFETLMETAPDSAAWNAAKFNSITAGPKVT